MATYVYGDKPETPLHSGASSSSKVVNKILMGTILRVQEDVGDWLKVDALGKGRRGFVRKSDVRDTPVFKVFFVDVGQGDGVIVESPEGVMLVDGGPNMNLYRFLCYRYRNILKTDKVRINAMVVSHPDYDHFNGLTAVLKDDRFEIGTIFHNGIIRYDPKNVPAGKEMDLGNTIVRTINGSDTEVLTDSFSTLTKAQSLIDEGHLQTSFRKFWEAAIAAKADGRLGSARRITVRDELLPGYTEEGEDKLFVKVLGPVPTNPSGNVEYVTFPDTHNLGKPLPSPSSSHTRNGHSLVLKLEFGDHSVLLGGDLNIPAQKYLLEYYDGENPFRVDVAKACHHGSSDYDVDYLKKVLPRANVFSSGDNKSFDHPMADAVGATARHTRGDHPLLFSTELARAESSTGTHYGLINLRSNGDTLVMAQMKEQRKTSGTALQCPGRGSLPDTKKAPVATGAF